jgi:hypothetical protein
MPQGIGLDAREATAALRARSRERLELAFGRLVEAESRARGWDPRDAMISLAPFLDCAHRMGLDPVEVLGPIAASGPDWYAETFDAFARRSDVSLADFGWSLVATPEGPAYHFAWPDQD